MIKKIAVTLLVLTLVLVGAALAQTPKKGGTLIFGRGGDSVGLDPAYESDGNSFMICDNVFEALVEYKDETTELEPLLATSWQISPDGLTYTFTPLEPLVVGWYTGYVLGQPAARSVKPVAAVIQATPASVSRERTNVIQRSRSRRNRSPIRMTQVAASRNISGAARTRSSRVMDAGFMVRASSSSSAAPVARGSAA